MRFGKPTLASCATFVGVSAGRALGFSGAFVVAPAAFRSSPATESFMMSDDFPSDSSVEALYDTPPSKSRSNDDALDVDSEDYIGTVSESLLNSVLNELPAAGSSDKLSKDARANINEALLRLEALNPTENPASSPLLNGVWNLRYAAGYTSEWALPSPTRQLALFLYSGGYSPGVFALSLAQNLPSQLVEVGDLTISISRTQPRVEASVDLKVFGSSPGSQVLVTADLEVESSVRLSETYTGATVMGNQVEIPKQLQYSRQIYITYLDEDLLIVRDGSGIPEVLIRREKSFKGNWGTEPSDVQDLTGPGEN